MKLLILFYYMTLSKFNLSELKDLILKTESISLPRFPITGKYLLEKGLRSGKKIGQVMKETRGRANPGVVTDLLVKELHEMEG